MWYSPTIAFTTPKREERSVWCWFVQQSTSLNEHLLAGPDLTKTFIGVLCRFRKGQIAVMCDVGHMSHQFHVAARDQDYLRFLWWEGDKMETPPSVFRMKVYLFSATSSPGCAKFELKHLAAKRASAFSDATAWSLFSATFMVTTD